MKIFFVENTLLLGRKLKNMRLNSSEEFSFFFRDHHDFRTKFVLGLRISDNFLFYRIGFQNFSGGLAKNICRVDFFAHLRSRDLSQYVTPAVKELMIELYELNPHKMTTPQEKPQCVSWFIETKLGV